MVGGIKPKPIEVGGIKPKPNKIKMVGGIKSKPVVVGGIKFKSNKIKTINGIKSKPAETNVRMKMYLNPKVWSDFCHCSESILDSLK